MALGLPNINIEFIQQGTSALQRGERGIVALILKDTAEGSHTIYDVTDIPSSLKAENKDFIELALIGNTEAPNRIEVFVLASGATEITEALDYFYTTDFNYLAMPEVTEVEATTITTWIKSIRDTEGRKVKAVLPNVAANHEGIINFTTDEIQVGATIYTTAKFCPRIAGLLAGTPLTISATYSVLSEVTDVPKKTNQELDEAIGNGELVLFKQGGKIKIARGVTSFTQVSEAKGDIFKKIKVVDILDLVYSDIRKTAHETYIGKYSNSYDNKCLLIAAIQGYFEQLEIDGLLERGKSFCGIDIAAQKAYLKSIGANTNDMDEEAIKKANTKDKVFLSASITPLDAIEEIALNISI